MKAYGKERLGRRVEEEKVGGKEGGGGEGGRGGEFLTPKLPP